MHWAWEEGRAMLRGPAERAFRLAFFLPLASSQSFEAPSPLLLLALLLSTSTSSLFLLLLLLSLCLFGPLASALASRGPQRSRGGQRN